MDVTLARVAKKSSAGRPWDSRVQSCLDLLPIETLDTLSYVAAKKQVTQERGLLT